MSLFSYCSRGLQLRFQRRRHETLKTIIPDYTTIQGVLEQAIRKVLQVEEVVVYNSSRTDAGVHAFSSTAHFASEDDGTISTQHNPSPSSVPLSCVIKKHLQSFPP